MRLPSQLFRLRQGSLFKVPYVTDDEPIPEILMVDSTKAAAAELQLWDCLSGMLLTASPSLYAIRL